ncbi:MAG: cob(I)yrinic acid a,c-diamide adenosyltransferase [Gammaproteobacteria bacterium]|nr:cob(I)yrinic acid a,c-diamide adenosyltransferase [Gammaproteobacteria bacterium]
MANRLTKIYTRSGDRGLTRLATGEQVSKAGTRIEAAGHLDETNSAIALILCEADVPDNVRSILTSVQHSLFDIGAELALPGHTAMGAEDVTGLEQSLDELNETLPPLTEFVLPGGPRSAASCHLARSVCRRAERSLWRLADDTELNPELLKYVNRLSDLLFVVARVLARQENTDEPLWDRDRDP